MDFGESIWTQLGGLLRGLFQWLIDAIIGTGTPVLDAIAGWIGDAIPASAELDLSALTPYISMVNAWVPLDLAVALFSAWLAYHIAMVTARFFLRMIPGL